MSTTTVAVLPPAPAPTKSNTTQLLLNSFEGYAYREVSLKPPRDCTEDEIPVLDMSGMDGDLEARVGLAKTLLSAAKNTGFFYIKNHGISEQVLGKALSRAKQFFALPLEEKMRAVSVPSISHYGYKPARSRRVNPTSNRDTSEAVNWHYEPRLDPLRKDNLEAVPQTVLDSLPKDAHLWDAFSTMGMYDIVPYYGAVLMLARRMIKIIALALDLPEDYFDELVKYPGGDMAINYYPGHGENPIVDVDEVGLGAHTDLQVLTILYQSDDDRGLQVLNSDNEWVYAPPIPGTFVINIGDFLMRLTNGRLKSTVHRVIQHGKKDRYSMPLFFGFDFGAKLAVLPTCVSEDNPAKYEPAKIGDLIRKRLGMADDLSDRVGIHAKGN